MHKALLISYYWPPAGGGGVFRWLKMSRYFEENNIDLTIYTPSNPEFPAIDESLLDEIPSSLKVLKYPIREPYGLYKRFTGKKKDSKVYSGFINDKKSLKQSLSVWIRGNFFIPDARKFWIRPSIKFLTQTLTIEKYDTIISTGPPHSMHLIGRGLKRRFPNLKWIVDFRDPWTNIDFYDQLKLSKRADRKHKELEKSVLIEADQVVTVGWTLAKELESIGNIEDVKVIQNGYDHLEFQEKVAVKGDFTIMHLGSMNKDRNPEVLWKTLNSLSKDGIKPKVRLIGQMDVVIKQQLKAYHLEKQVSLEPFMSHKDAIIEMMGAHVLLLVINNTPNAAGILTGKLFEYLGAGRPIIAIGPEIGDVRRLLEDYQHAHYITYNDIEKCSSVVTQLWQQRNSVDSVEDNQKYSRKNLAGQYCDLIKELHQ